jgi:hypothetical protein
VSRADQFFRVCAGLIAHSCLERIRALKRAASQFHLSLALGYRTVPTSFRISNWHKNLFFLSFI